MPWARWNFPPASATIAGLETDIQDAYDHNIAGLEIGQGGVPTTDQLVAIYNKAQRARRSRSASRWPARSRAARTRTPTRSRAGRSPSPGRRSTPARTFSGAVTGSATGTIIGGARLPLHGQPVPDHRDRRPRPLVRDRPDRDADRHEHERLPGRDDRRDAQLDRAGRAGRRAVARAHDPRGPVRHHARDADPRRARSS